MISRLKQFSTITNTGQSYCRDLRHMISSTQ
nr:MAG TPA: hypothetical protein [Crassvirales sp.]DAX21726.1 MAG TPA: hypothetical protein [Caudoviricetes sp.]